MNKKSRFDFSQAEVQVLIIGLKASGDPTAVKITTRLMRHGLKVAVQESIAAKSGLKALYDGNDAAGIVKKFLAKLSGWEEAELKSGTTIDELGLNSEHISILRVNLNKWIKANGGSGSIAEGEIKGSTTVQKLTDLVTSKL